MCLPEVCLIRRQAVEKGNGKERAYVKGPTLNFILFVNG